jgi:hypothetical protein
MLLHEIKKSVTLTKEVLLKSAELGSMQSGSFEVRILHPIVGLRRVDVMLGKDDPRYDHSAKAQWANIHRGSI